MTHPWQLTRTRWGWAWRVYEHGRDGAERTGWRPWKSWAWRAATRASQAMR